MGGVSIGELLYGVIHFYMIIVVVWCLLSWFPNVRWYDQPFKSLDMVVRPFVEPFRKFIPTIGQIDISPMVAIILLQLVGGFIRHLPF